MPPVVYTLMCFEYCRVRMMGVGELTKKDFEI